MEFLLVVEDELRKSQFVPTASPKQPLKKGKSNGPPDLPPPRHNDKPPPLPPLDTLPSRKIAGNNPSTPDASPKDHRPPKSLATERPAPPKIRPYQPDRAKPDLPGKPTVSDKKPQLPPGRPALPERFANKSATGGSRSRSVSTNNDTASPSRPHQEQRKVNTMKPLSSANKSPVIPNQTTSPSSKVPLQPPSRPLPPGRPRGLKKHGSLDKSTSVTGNTSAESVSTRVGTNDPAQIMEELNRISANLTDIASEGLPVFNRSLEDFAQLSEQMLTLMQSHGKSVFVTMKLSQLREKVSQFRSLMGEINSNPSRDYTSQLDGAVSEISKKFGDLYSKAFN